MQKPQEYEMDADLQEEEEEAYLRSLKVCARQEDLHRGSRLHAFFLKRGFLFRNVALANGCINLYAKSGRFSAALGILEELAVPDVVSWTALISGYAQHGFNKEALRCLDRMQEVDGVLPNEVTLSCVLKACSNLGDLGRGQELHTDIVAKGLLTESCFIGGALVDMYVKCGALIQAQQVFDGLPNRTVVSWTSIIAGYCERQHDEQALGCFQQMKCEGLSPNAVTFSCILRACGSMRAVDKGMEVHANIIKMGCLEIDNVLGNSLLDLYCRCGVLEKAQQVFNDLIAWDVVSWNVLVTGYVQFGHGDKALLCFERMRSEGFVPNVVTFSIILQACGSIGAAEEGTEIHSEINRRGLLNNELANALMDMYAKCSLFTKAQQLFDELWNRDVVSWNILVTGYCLHEEVEEAIDCYDRMLLEGAFPDAVTFLGILKACGITGAIERGLEVHAEVVRKGFWIRDITLGNALVDMYAKCGMLIKAQEVFDDLGVKTLVAWTSLIAGLCDHGHYGTALMCFKDMERQGICPDLVNLSCILKACGSIEATKKDESFYEAVTATYGIIPTIMHQKAIAQLFACTGQFDNAIAVIKEAPISLERSSWFSLLSACQNSEIRKYA